MSSSGRGKKRNQMTGKVITDPATGLPVLPDGYWGGVAGGRITRCAGLYPPRNLKGVHRAAAVTPPSGQPADMKAAPLLVYGQVRFRLEREAEARKDCERVSSTP